MLPGCYLATFRVINALMMYRRVTGADQAFFVSLDIREHRMHKVPNLGVGG